MSVVSQTHADRGCLMPSQVVHRVESYSAVKRASVCGVNSLTIVVLSGLASVCHYVPLAYTCHPKTQLLVTSIAAVRRNKPEKRLQLWWLCLHDINVVEQAMSMIGVNWFYHFAVYQHFTTKTFSDSIFTVSFFCVELFLLSFLPVKPSEINLELYE